MDVCGTGVGFNHTTPKQWLLRTLALVIPFAQHGVGKLVSPSILYPPSGVMEPSKPEGRHIGSVCVAGFNAVVVVLSAWPVFCF